MSYGNGFQVAREDGRVFSCSFFVLFLKHPSFSSFLAVQTRPHWRARTRTTPTLRFGVLIQRLALVRLIVAINGDDPNAGKPNFALAEFRIFFGQFFTHI